MNLLIAKDKEHTKLPGVMRAALRLFVKKGIDGTTIKDIAREARVAEGSLYRHYKSKDDLAWHLFSAHLKQFTNDLTTKVFAESTAKGQIQKFVEESFAAYDSDPDLYTYLILHEHSELDKYSKEYIHPGHIVLHIIEEGQKSGEIKAGDPYILGSLFVGGVIRVAIVKMYGSIREELTKYTGEVAEDIWIMLKAQDQS